MSGRPARRWAFLQADPIADLRDPERVYLWRLRIVETPWFGVLLHRLRLPDSDRHLHNHPWGFVSLILAGGYTETFAATIGSGEVSRTWRPWSLHRITRANFHAIRTLGVGSDADGRAPSVWTLLAIGPRSQDWGYATETGYVDHVSYHAARAAEIAATETGS